MSNREGWQCPACRNCYSPDVTECGCSVALPWPQFVPIVPYVPQIIPIPTYPYPWEPPWQPMGPIWTTTYETIIGGANSCEAPLHC